MNQRLVTVYITNHNYGRFIRQAVESVLSQTLKDVEILIIDDGSTDDSRSIIETYSEHPQIKIIYQENKGLNITNNLALRVAQGTYIMRLDSDDYLDPHALEILSGALDKDSNLGLVFPDYYLVDTEGSVMGVERRHNFEKEVTLLDQPAHGACTMIRRQNLLELGGYDEAYSCQDGYELWIKFTTRFKVKSISLPLFYYRQHGSNLTRNEERILSTRSRIKQAHVDRLNSSVRAQAVLPVRGPSIESSSVALLPLGHDRVVLDWCVDAALNSNRVDHVIVTTSDEAILDYMARHYNANSRVRALRRPAELARLNSKLEESLRFVLSELKQEGLQVNYMVRLACEFPFLSSRCIDEAVNSLLVFDADLVIGVRPETALLFQHHGNGLVPVANMDKFTRLEREALFRLAGGLTAFRSTALEHGLMDPELRRSHVVVDQRSAHGLFTEFDYQMARVLVDQTKG